MNFGGFKSSPVKSVTDTIKKVLEPGIVKFARAIKNSKVDSKALTTGFSKIKPKNTKGTSEGEGRGTVMNKPTGKKTPESEKLKKSTTSTKSKTLSYKDAYKKADKSKYKTYGEFEKAAKAYNTKKYGTTEPTRDAKKGGMTKSQLASKVSKTKTTPKATTKATTKKVDLNTATVSDKKSVGPKNRVTVKKAKSNKKVGVKEAKQKGYETKKDRRTAVRDARKTGRAEVKEARVNKRVLRKAVKATKKRDKAEVKGAIGKAKNAAKADKLQSKIDRSSKGAGKVSSRRNLKRADKINKLNA